MNSGELVLVVKSHGGGSKGNKSRGEVWRSTIGEIQRVGMMSVGDVGVRATLQGFALPTLDCLGSGPWPSQTWVQTGPTDRSEGPGQRLLAQTSVEGSRSSYLSDRTLGVGPGPDPDPLPMLNRYVPTNDWKSGPVSVFGLKSLRPRPRPVFTNPEWSKDRTGPV